MAVLNMDIGRHKILGTGSPASNRYGKATAKISGARMGPGKAGIMRRAGILDECAFMHDPPFFPAVYLQRRVG